jgi:hypothetical protein
MQSKNLFCTTALALALSACGGGGGDGGNNGPAVTSTPSPLTKYLGVWVSNCVDAPLSAETAPTVPLKERLTYDFRSTAENSLFYVLTIDIYPTSGCAGAPLASHRGNYQENKVVVDGTKLIHASTADKITIGRGPFGTEGSRLPYVRNGIIYPGDYLISTSNNKDVAQFSGASFNFGNPAPADADGYPTTLNSVVTFTKAQ